MVGNRTYRDGVDEGSDSKGQAAAQHGEDGVGQVVVDRVGQRALGHVHRGLGSDGGLLSVRWAPILHLASVNLTRKSQTRFLVGVGDMYEVGQGPRGGGKRERHASACN